MLEDEEKTQAVNNELEKALPDFEIVVGTIEAYSIGNFVKNYLKEQK